MQTATPASLLEYWFGNLQAEWPASAALTRRWFNATRKDDTELEARFGERVEQALGGDLQSWEAAASDRLALILLLDQLPRNIFRGQARAFAGDARAAQLVLDGMATGLERELGWAGQVFFYMPLMHAEDMESQRHCVDSFSQLRRRVPAALQRHLDGNLRFAREHLEIIERFGRFPHRNAVLGRVSTAAELSFLTSAPRYGQ